MSPKDQCSRSFGRRLETFALKRNQLPPAKNSHSLINNNASRCPSVESQSFRSFSSAESYICLTMRPRATQINSQTIQTHSLRFVNRRCIGQRDWKVSCCSLLNTITVQLRKTLRLELNAQTSCETNIKSCLTHILNDPQAAINPPSLRIIFSEHNEGSLFKQ